MAELILPASWVPFDRQKLQRGILQQFSHASFKADKELNRFMSPTKDLDTLEPKKKVMQGLRFLASGAWLADLEQVPRLPAKLLGLWHGLSVVGPRSDDLSIDPSGDLSVVALAKTEGGLAKGVGDGETHNLDNELTSTIIVLKCPSRSLEHIELALHELIQDADRDFTLLIVIEPGAVVTLYDKLSVSHVHARTIIGLVGEGAQVKIISDHEYSSQAYGMQHELWKIERGAHLTTVAGLTGGNQTCARKEFILADEATVEHCVLYALKNTEQSALITRQVHQGKKSKSSVLVKSLMQDTAYSFYRGTIVVQEGAEGSQADQQQKALILSPTARTCAIPSLEVATHEVQCRHGSAAGRFNKDELWFLAARGLDQKQSYALLIDGFYNENIVDQNNEFAGALKNRLIGRCKPIESSSPDC